MKAYGLVADIGGTHIRLAMVNLMAKKLAVANQRTLSTKDHPHIVAAARAYLEEVKASGAPERIVFGVAGPVTKGAINLTNAGWRFTAEELREQLGAKTALLVNDYEALAGAIAAFGPDDLVTIGSGPGFDAHVEGTVAIVGPGTGLGVGGRITRGGVHFALVTEGGHAAFAPGDELEIEVLRILRRKAGRVSNERLLSGPGLLNLYRAMAEIEGITASDTTPEDITRMAQRDRASFEARVFERFCTILGSVAGDVALTFGAREGVLIGGGILPDAVALLQASAFRTRFEDKARFKSYMQAIPTALILQPQAGLIGAAEILREQLAAAAQK